MRWYDSAYIHIFIGHINDLDDENILADLGY